MRKSIVASLVLSGLFVSTSVFGQVNLKTPTLHETLTWLSGASESESGDGNDHYTFESTGNSGCTVIITEMRAKASPGFWIKESFSLADIDPIDIQVEDLGQGEYKNLFEGQSSVRFHTTNYRKTISSTSYDQAEAIPTSDYILLTKKDVRSTIREGPEAFGGALRGQAIEFLVPNMENRCSY